MTTLCPWHDQAALKVAIATAVFFPLVLAMVAISSLFMSPLLPLLGLPLFLPAFPRPRRQWVTVSSSVEASTTDAALYQQLVPELSASLREMAASGTLGELEPGACLLVRMDTLVAGVQVLETGMGRWVVSVRGLEHQEPTSCHHVEAGVLDGVFEQINKDETPLKGCVLCGGGRICFLHSGDAACAAALMVNSLRGALVICACCCCCGLWLWLWLCRVASHVCAVLRQPQQAPRQRSRSRWCRACDGVHCHEDGTRGHDRSRRRAHVH